MPVFSCDGCKKLISLSVIPGGNPATRDPAVWASIWRMCRECKSLLCEQCNPGGSAPCASCGGDVHVPDAATRLAMYFHSPAPALQSAPDAADRTWQEDLAIAMQAGLPALAGTRLLASGVPDLADAYTRGRYLRWLSVFSWVVRPTEAIAREFEARIDPDGSVTVDDGRIGCVWGSSDPYGAAAMRFAGRWANPAPEDCLALALRVAWTSQEGQMEGHVRDALNALTHIEESALTPGGDARKERPAH